MTRRWWGIAVSILFLLKAGIAFAEAQPSVVQQQPPSEMVGDMAGHVLGCAPCHGPHGEGGRNPYFPRLAGKPAGYLFNQLLAFHQGRRRYAPMNYLLEFQREDFLKAMAAYFAAQRLTVATPSAAAASQAILQHGEDLVTHGAADRGIPPCSACHGSRLTGMQPAIPGLVGLNDQYIIAQLGAWRYGTRTATAPDCMQEVAARLTDADVTAVAAWLSSQPVPSNPAPVPHGTLHMPLRCGSEPP